MDDTDANESWHDCDCKIVRASSYLMLITIIRNPDIPARIATLVGLVRWSLRWGT
jgi:hypothetical protein